MDKNDRTFVVATTKGKHVVLECEGMVRSVRGMDIVLERDIHADAHLVVIAKIRKEASRCFSEGRRYRAGHLSDLADWLENEGKSDG